MAFQCLDCEAPRERAGRCVVCLGSAVVEVGAPRVESSAGDDEEEGDDDRFTLRSIDPRPVAALALGSATCLARALGGKIPRGSPVLVSGAPGSGKTTEIVRLVASLPPREPVYWVDREMGDDLLATFFRERGLDLGRVRLVEGSARAVVELARAAPRGLLVVDSLSRLVPNEARQVAFVSDLLDACREKRSSALVIAHFDKGGKLRGDTLLQGFVDAVFVVDLEKIVTTKARWPTPRETARDPYEA